MDNAEDDKLCSVQAQFMACHELIASQFGKHWVPTDRIYEDRGYSGSNIRRPGLQELLSDVADGLVDIVVVHRLDRLSRHLGDFSALMQDFERHGVALVSVTQSIDTSGPQWRPHAVAFHFARRDQLATGLAPVGVRPCWAHKRKGSEIIRALVYGGGVAADNKRLKNKQCWLVLVTAGNTKLNAINA
jgi:hypothetical protein